jgi:hypothetical protein
MTPFDNIPIRSCRDSRLPAPPEKWHLKNSGPGNKKTTSIFPEIPKPGDSIFSAAYLKRPVKCVFRGIKKNYFLQT